MTTAQVIETSVTVNNNSPIQDYVHLDDQTQPTFEMTPGFKTFHIISNGYRTDRSTSHDHMYDSGQVHVTSNQPSMFCKEELKFQPTLS